MSGLPVSHVGEKVSGGVISTGSPTVHVGSSAVCRTVMSSRDWNFSSACVQAFCSLPRQSRSAFR